MTRPTLDQINLVCGDMDASIAFYRMLGIDIFDIWRTETGAHHVTALRGAEAAMNFDLDSTAFAQKWNRGWAGRADLKGRVVIGFSVETRADVDALFNKMTMAGYPGLQEPFDAFWGARYAI